MVCFSWQDAPTDTTYPDSDHQRSRAFQSAFTYNTEFNYDNRYTNWDQSNNYSQLKDRDNDNFEAKPQSTVEIIIVGLSFVLLICTLPFSLLLSLKFISSYERLVILRLGRAQKVRGPGTTLVLPFIDKTAKIDVRANSYELPDIHVITIDKGICEYATTVCCKVVDPLRSYCRVQDRETTIKSLAYTSTYKHLSKKKLHDITNPPNLSRILNGVQQELNKFSQPMGIEIVELKVTKINVLKQSENQAVALFNTLLKSDVGSTVMKHLQTQLLSHVSSKEADQSIYRDNNKSESSVSATASAEVHSTVCSEDLEIEELIEKIRQCCDYELVRLVQKCYRVLCINEQGSETDFIVNLKEGNGCVFKTSCVAFDPTMIDVTFTLSKPNLFQLVNGSLTPFAAYMSGDVKVTGTVADAMGLKHLMQRAKEIRCI